MDACDLSGETPQLKVDGKPLDTRTLIIATGAGHRHLGLENEAKLENKGVTYCATCDGALPMFRDKPLVVVGGGDSACEEATYLTRFASKVYLVHRRDELRASKIMADRAIGHEKIEMVWDSVVSDIHGVEEDAVTGVQLENLNRCLHSLDSRVFVAIGHVQYPALRGQLAMDEAGYICGKGRFRPKGSLWQGCADQVYRQAITAAGMGCMLPLTLSATSEN